MKRIRAGILALVMTAALALPCTVFGATATYGGYYSYRQGTSGTAASSAASSSAAASSSSSASAAASAATHPKNMANYNLAAVSANYYVNGKAHPRDKSSLVLNVTGGNAESLDLVPGIGKYLADQTQQYPLSFALDTGNDSMAAPYDSIFASQAPALRLLGTAGYDYTAISASELSEGAGRLAAMPSTAAKSGDTVPYITASNVSGGKSVVSALQKHGAQNDYVVLSKYGTKIAVFNLIGKNAAGSPEGLKTASPVSAAKRIVKNIRKNDSDVSMIVCITDHGESDSLSLEKRVASSVKGINVILTSGKTDSSSAVKSGSTRIFRISRSSGHVGHIVLQMNGAASGTSAAAAAAASSAKTSFSYKSFKVQKITSKSGKTAAVTSKLNSFNSSARSAFQKTYGFPYSDVLTSAAKKPGTLKELQSAHTDTGLSDLITDSYLRFAKNNGVKARTSLLSSDAVKAELPSGDISMSDVSTMLSGEKAYGSVTGNPLVSFYVKGSDLKHLAELASNMAKSSDGNRLYFGGVQYTYNPHRLPGNRVYDMKFTNGAKVKGSELYRVVTDRDSLKQIQSVSDKSSSAVSVILRSRSGSKVTSVKNIKASGRVLRAWAAVSSRLESYGSKGLPASYTKADGRVVYDNSILPTHLMKGASRMVGVIVAVIVIAVCLVILLIILLVKVFGGGSGRGGRGGRRRRVRYPGRTKEHNIFR